MRLLLWIVGLPVAAAVISFAARNREPVPLDLGPFDYAPEPPVFAIMVGSLIAGFGLGGLVSWISSASRRRRARATARRLEAAERELGRLRAKVADLEDAGSDGTRGLPPPIADAAAGAGARHR